MPHLLFPGLLRYGDEALLLLRLMVAAVFFTSGLSHVRDPAGRGRSIGQGPRLTFLIGCAEIAGSLGVALGVLTQAAAIGLILVMLGAIWKKIFVWKTGFWGEKSPGWHYDLMLVLMCLVIATTGGRYVLLLTVNRRPRSSQAPDASPSLSMSPRKTRARDCRLTAQRPRE
jgi:putative oxidoreductase